MTNILKCQLFAQYNVTGSHSYLNIAVHNIPSAACLLLCSFPCLLTSGGGGRLKDQITWKMYTNTQPQFQTSWEAVGQHKQNRI